MSLTLSVTCMAQKTLEIKKQYEDGNLMELPPVNDTIYAMANLNATAIQLKITNPNGVQVFSQMYSWPLNTNRICIDLPTIPDNYALVVRDNFGVIYYAIGIDF